MGSRGAEPLAWVLSGRSDWRTQQRQSCRSPASPFGGVWRRNLPMLIVTELAHPALKVKG